MTDKEVIKALECCVRVRSLSDCLKSGCPARKREGCSYFLRTDDVFEGVIFVELIKDAINLINRQKAENERLTAERDAMHQDVIAAEEYAWQCKTAKAEAYKEFAERLKDKHRRITDYDEAGFGAQIFIFEERVIDNLLKEMVGDKE